MTGTQDWEAEKAAREAAWWERWWAEDFRWEVLGARRDDGSPVKPWIGWSTIDDEHCVQTQSAPKGSEPATLQDYFRWDPNAKRLRSDEELLDARLLIQNKDEKRGAQNEDESHPVFHILHLPQAYKDGTPTFKADLKAEEWADLEAEIARLLSRSGQTDKGIGQPDCASADLRAQLTGAVLRAFPRPPTPERQFSLHLVAQHAVFLAPADANGVEFGSPAILAQALFCSTADFSMVEFSGGHANFSDAEFSGGDAYFSHAEFSGGDADFLSAQFSGGRANFLSAQFSGGHAYFLSAQFSGGHADFSHAEFSGGHAYFSGAEFSGGDADFLSASFSHGATFAGARFLKTCEFGRSDQPGRGAPIPGAKFLRHLNLRSAYFEGRADFSRVSFPDKAEDRNSAFEGTRFFEPLDLKGVGRLPFSAFHGIRLDKGLLLDSHHPEPDQFDQALAESEAAIARDATESRTGHDAERSGADARYAALEAGCRALKEAMAADGDRKREQEFFSHELAARERRVRHRLHDLKAHAKTKTWYRPTSWVSSKAFSVRTELLASRLYARLSGYGGSILRPLAAWAAFGMIVAIVLTALVAGFAMAGGAIGEDLCFGMECGPTLHPVVTDTLDALIRGALGPFRLLAGRGEPFAYLGDTAPVFRSLVGGIMLVHGLISSALIFLCLLALRRQFQIN